MVSRPRGPIGGWVWVYGVNTKQLRKCKIVDVSQPWDLARHERMGRVVEIAGELERTFCGHHGEPVVKCPVVVYDAD
jgi:hypothetical protein